MWAGSLGAGFESWLSPVPQAPQLPDAEDVVPQRARVLPEERWQLTVASPLETAGCHGEARQLHK